MSRDQDQAMRRLRIRRAFGRAHDYERSARVQALAAEDLARRVLDLWAGLPKAHGSRARGGPTALEVGCGSGLLTKRLIEGTTFSAYLATDISLGMARRFRDRFGVRAGLRLAVMDAARPAVRGRFDLVASNFALQWAHDLPATLAALQDLLAPAGIMALAVPGAGSLGEWTRALDRAGLARGLMALPDRGTLETLGFAVHERMVEEIFPSGLDFLRSLKSVGATVPSPGYRLMPPGHLRRALDTLERSSDGVVRMTWRVLEATFQAGG